MTAGRFDTNDLSKNEHKSGVVLTPDHIAELFCDLAGIGKNDVLLEPSCGTGRLIVPAMQKGIAGAVGVEIRQDLLDLAHAATGEAVLINRDFFAAMDEVKAAKPTAAFINPPYDGGPDMQLKFVEGALDCLAEGGVCVAICQMSTALKKLPRKRSLMQKHTLEAVLSMPDDLFHPVGVVTCVHVFRAGAAHPPDHKTFFGYCKDDGFVKAKNRGRIDRDGKWPDIKAKWLEAYRTRADIPGLSVTETVGPDDEWCAECYMETDYGTLTEQDFVRTVKLYNAYLYLRDVQ